MKRERVNTIKRRPSEKKKAEPETCRLHHIGRNGSFEFEIPSSSLEAGTKIYLKSVHRREVSTPSSGASKTRNGAIDEISKDMDADEV